MRWTHLVRLACCMVVAGGGDPAHAGSLAGVFKEPAFAQLGLAPLGDALAATISSAYPVASASSSVRCIQP